MDRELRWRLTAVWLLWLPVGLWLSGGGCTDQDLAGLDLPLAAWRTLSGPAAKASTTASASAVVVIDTGDGWHRAKSWSPKTRKLRCMAVWQGVEAALSMGASVIGIDLLLGRDETGRPHTCAPITPEEKTWWRRAGKRWDERIVLPVALRLPKFVHVQDQNIRPVDPGPSRRGIQPPIAQSGPILVPQLRRFAQGHVNLFTDRGVLRRATGRLGWPQGPKDGVPSMAAELLRLARQRASLKGNADARPGPRGDAPFLIYWGPGRLQRLRLQHLQHPHPKIAKILQGAVVLFGAVETPARSDLFATPHGIVSGVEVHAQIAATLLFGPIPHRGAWWQLWLLLTLLCLTGIWLGWSQRPWWWRAVLGTGAWLLAMCLAVAWYDQWGWLPPLWTGILSALSGVFVGQGLRLQTAQQERRQLQDNIFRALHPEEGRRLENAPTTGRSLESTAPLALQHYPTPIARAYVHALEGTSHTTRDKPLYDAIMGYGYTLALASRKEQTPASPALPSHDGAESAALWQTLITATGPDGLWLPELYHTWHPAQRWEQQALEHMQQLLSSRPPHNASLYDQERLAMERWDLLNWFLRDQMGWLRHYPLLWLEQIKAPEPSYAMRFDPWAALLEPPPLVMQQMMGPTPISVERPAAHPLQHHRFYVDLNGHYLTLDPHWSTAVSQKHEGQTP